MRLRNRMITNLNYVFNAGAIELLIKAVDAKDEYTQGHSRRMGKIGREVDGEPRSTRGAGRGCAAPLRSV